ncbi:hypothetical protein BHD05_13125 [Marisediminicola antarctica]|uniref:DUF4395 domain-containing protein n=1 Tax=Marisediminicola antarctica TaxID=674079 RepID=A0A7L5AM88_9MICO|nr:hypothetical protein BHD05_13125 [Marisediminicola antarctica]
MDPRGPRFGAGITALLLLVVVALDLSGFTTSAAALLGAIAALFAWGAFAGIQRHPYGVLYARFVRPRLAPTSEREGAAPPTFAQGVGLAVTLVGLVLHLAGVPLAISIAAGAAFIAAFLNAAFAYCLGCQIYLGLLRAGLLGRSARV